MTGSEAPPSFRLAYVPGVTPGKWVRIWDERMPGLPLTLVPITPGEADDVLRGGGADAGLVRTPVDRTVLSAIPLYTETTVVVVPKDHVVAAADEVSLAELADEVMFHPLDDTLGWERPPGRPAYARPDTTKDAIELVAAGVGVLVVPQSLARLHHRKDLTYRTVTDAPQSTVALSWREDRTTDEVEEFIGIVRGRTVNSSRGPARADAAQPRAKAGPKGTAGGTAAGRKSGTGSGSSAGTGSAARGSAGGRSTGEGSGKGKAGSGSASGSGSGSGRGGGARRGTAGGSRGGGRKPGGRGRR